MPSATFYRSVRRKVVFAFCEPRKRKWIPRLIRTEQSDSDASAEGKRLSAYQSVAQERHPLESDVQRVSRGFIASDNQRRWRYRKAVFLALRWWFSHLTSSLICSYLCSLMCHIGVRTVHSALFGLFRRDAIQVWRLLDVKLNRNVKKVKTCCCDGCSCVHVNLYRYSIKTRPLVDYARMNDWPTWCINNQLLI